MLDRLTKELFSRNPQSFLRDMAEMKPIFAMLIEVIKSFGLRFDQVKEEKGLVDFSDLEHLCLEILADKEEGGAKLRPSEIANGYRSHFKEVLVDEYQDTNMVQETILRLVSADGEYDGNLFMVGDIKQSIYGFRLAEPNLFLGKYLRFSPDGEGTGLRIDLSRNFRSRKEILDGTNFLFKQIMGSSVGEIDYNEDAELVKGSGYSLEENYPIELTILDQSDENSEAEQDDG